MSHVLPSNCVYAITLQVIAEAKQSDTMNEVEDVHEVLLVLLFFFFFLSFSNPNSNPFSL